MATRASSRISKEPVRFEDECFKPGANNRHTVGRAVDAGHSAKLESDDRKVGDFMEVDGDFVVGDEEVEYDDGGSESEGEGDESESEGDESESEGEGDEGEGDESEGDESEGDEGESEGDEDNRLYWGEKNALPEDTYFYTLHDGLWTYICYVRVVDGEYIVTFTDWLEEFPENIHNEHEWNGKYGGEAEGCYHPRG